MEQEKILYHAVLCFFLDRNNNILLAIKQKHIGAGKYNGYGGGQEKGETEKEACVREVQEETGGITIRESDLLKRADAYFSNITEEGKSFTCHVAIFVARTWNGQPSTTPEMANPKWFKLSDLPKRMMPADPFWLPNILSEKKFIVRAQYGPHQASLIGRVEIEEINGLN